VDGLTAGSDGRAGVRAPAPVPAAARRSVLAAALVAFAAALLVAGSATGAPAMERAGRLGAAPSDGAVAARPVATGTSRAAVIVDTGSRVIRTVISFDGSISGAEALRRAGADPVFTIFSGEGAAVCSLYGVGHGPGDCFGVASGDGRYWGYFRAPAGSTSFRYWGAGASSTLVHDGDVEGWSFGARPSAPAYVSVAELAGDPRPGGSGSGSPGGVKPGTSPGAGTGGGASPPSTAAPAGGGSGSAPSTGGGAPSTARPAPSVEGAVAERPGAAAGDGGTRPDEHVPATRDRSRGEASSGPAREAAARRGAGAGAGGTGGGSASSLAWFAVAAVALGAGLVIARRVRTVRGRRA